MYGKSINIISLGCSKNLVDSEKLMKQLSLAGWNVFFESEEDADILLINTCGFIADAKEESIDTILKGIEDKSRGYYKQVVAFGCLVQRYKKELAEEIPEIDALFGVNEIEKLLLHLDTPSHLHYINHRIRTTPSHYAYLKVSEGCNRNCSFCIIPSIRGKLVSRPINSLVEEAGLLAADGVKELILIAQDLTSYGKDLKIENSLMKLVKAIEKINGIEWIRLHYTYPAGFPVELLSVMACSSKILPYLDIPFQHTSDNILKRMKRGHSHSDNMRLIEKIRNTIPNVAIRTTLITGFPGETISDHNMLKSFVEEVKFERLGVFTYSQEEGTSAAFLSDDVAERVKQERAAEIMEIQEDISYQNNLRMIGAKIPVIIDSVEGESAIARTKHDSPEVDQEVYISNIKNVTAGEITEISITDASPFELYSKLST